MPDEELAATCASAAAAIDFQPPADSESCVALQPAVVRVGRRLRAVWVPVVGSSPKAKNSFEGVDALTMTAHPHGARPSSAASGAASMVPRASGSAPPRRLPPKRTRSRSEALYRDGACRMERRELAAMEKARLEEEEQARLTFGGRRQTVARPASECKRWADEQFLAHARHGQELEARRKREAQDREDALMRECSFKPTLVTASRRRSSRARSGDRQEFGSGVLPASEPRLRWSLPGSSFAEPCCGWCSDAAAMTPTLLLPAPTMVL
mmetsp:Transcript_87177/g.244611  ORF Transcript_87177/g.244611 Transcript_87177/m.244611 type:complete len:268 (-) Transcript_87177:48-851(-)